MPVCLYTSFFIEQEQVSNWITKYIFHHNTKKPPNYHQSQSVCLDLLEQLQIMKHLCTYVTLTYLGRLNIHPYIILLSIWMRCTFWNKLNVNWMSSKVRDRERAACLLTLISPHLLAPGPVQILVFSAYRVRGKGEGLARAAPCCLTVGPIYFMSLILNSQG